MDAIQTIYIALFGRPADPLGLAYWDGVTTGGADLSAIGDLANEAEYQDRFEGMNGQQIITSIYQSLFGRNPEQAGLSYFLEELNSGRQNINTIAINIAQGAKGADADILANKVEAANAFTAAIDTPDEIAAYVGDAAADKGRAFLSTVTADEASIPDADAVAAAVADLSVIVGDAFTLTEGVDTFVGTSDNDTFLAQINSGFLNTNPTTINTFDNIDGGAGTDTLKIVGNGGAAINSNATIKNIEIVEIATTGAISSLSSASFEGVKQVWQVGVSGNISVGSGVTAGFRESTLRQVTALDGVDAVSVNLDNATAGGSLRIAEATAGDVTSVDVNGSVVSNGALTINTATGTTAVDTINLGITSNSAVTVTADAAVLTALDAATSTGNLGINLGGTYVALETLTGGSGNDTVTFSTVAGTTAETITVDLGAGNDVFNFDAANVTAGTAVSITLGAGNDTLKVGALANITAITAIDGDLVTVTDFNAAQDVLDLSGLGGLIGRDVLVNTELANISAAATLAAAAELAAQATTNGGYSVFNYGSDAYILQDNGGNGFDAGDGLIKVVGFSVEEITATNFIA